MAHSTESGASGIRQAVGRRLRFARIEAGLTTTKAAERIGISQPALTSYERGTRNLSVARLNEIAATYNVTTAWFFGGNLTDTRGGRP